MFGNKKKLDSKIRFQNSRFRQQLKRARGYKRTVSHSPQTDRNKFLSRIGLGSWAARVACLAVFLLLIYLVFVPNIFFIKQTTLNGANTASYQDAANLIQSYLNKKNPWPQKNLILLSKNGLKKFLLQNDRQILSVDNISKQFPSTLIVKIIPRIDMFAVQTASSSFFSISNDGIITNELIPNASGTLPSGLTLIKLTSNPSLNLGDKVLAQGSVNFINALQNQLPAIIKSPIDHYELEDFQNLALTVYAKTGFVLKIDLAADPAVTLQRINLLFSQFASGDIKKLAYVDMRFKDRGYVCYLGTPCAEPAVIPQSTSTPAN